MTSQVRSVRPEPANFEVFIDTCLRVAAERDTALPAALGDRPAWDDAYRELREQLDRHPRRAAPRAPVSVAQPRRVDPVPSPEPAPPATRREPLLTRRQLVLTASVALTLGGLAALAPGWLRGSGLVDPAADDEHSPDGYSPVGKLLSPPGTSDNPVWAVAIGRLDGEPVAVVGRGDGTVQLWNPVTGVARTDPLAGHDKPVYSIGLDAPLAVSAGVDGTLRVWDLAVHPPTCTRVGEQLAGGLNSVALVGVGGRTAAVSAGDDHTVRLWDPTAPRLVGRVLGERLDSQVKSIAAGSLDGVPIAVSGSADGTVRLWDLEAGRVTRLLGAHEDTVWTVAIGTVDRRTIAVSGSDDGEIRTWDLTAEEPTGTRLSRIANAVKTIAIGTINGRTVAVSGNDDVTIRVWDLATGRPYGNGLAGPEQAAEAIALSGVGGRTVVVSGHWDGSIWTWSL
ncbi:WD40 repeat domain-containing protein [Actinosynnema sp. NPDC050801]|uniref:WD40 repeat domain-containing protein n=1 Tax=unclassified Actinosynnema TaxID=2637065 RepID=UPI0034106432